jgi:transcriptional regulator with XRE-family HTH domain
MKTTEIGQRIRQIRLERGMTQDQLAEDTFSKSYISAIELGKIKPSLTALTIIAQRLKVPMAVLVSNSAQIPNGTLALRRAALMVKIEGQAQATLDLLQAIQPETPSAIIQKLLTEGQALARLGDFKNAAHRLNTARQMLNQPADSARSLPEAALELLNRTMDDTEIEILLAEAENLLAASELATHLANRKTGQ